MEERLRSGWLAVDFFTQSYRISGHIDVRRRALFDILNDPTTGFVRLEDAYISPLDRPGEIIATYSATTLVKANLTFAIVPLQEDALSRKQTYGSYLGTFLQQVFLTVPSFEIVGYLRLSAKVDLRRVLTSETSQFIAVLDGRVRGSIRPDITFTGGGILVNKRHIGAFSISQEEEIGG